MTNANRKRQLAVETAAKEGLRASVPLYIAAAEAFAQEDRPAQGLELLGELLHAKEKRRGLFGRVEKNPLGPERLRVATKYAELAHVTSPTEDSLETLNDLATEFADVAVIRRANADGLRNAGYAADAIEEYRTCWKLEPQQGDIPVRLSELFAALGRSDEAAEHLREGIELHAKAGQFEQVADRAMRFIDLNPAELDAVFDSMELIPGEVMKKHVPALDHLGVLVRRDPTREADWRVRMEQRLVDLYTRVLLADPRNGAARRGINVLGPQYLTEVENKLRTAPKPAGAPSPVAAAAATPATPAAAMPAPSAPEASPPPAAFRPTVSSAIAQPENAETSAAPETQAAPSAAPAEKVPQPAEDKTPAPAAPPEPVRAQEPPPVAAESVAATPPPAPAQQPAQSPAPTQQPTQVTPLPPAAAPVAAAAASSAQAPAAAASSAQAPAAAASTAQAPTAGQPAQEAPAGPRTPSSALYAFALRKAQEQYDAANYGDAAQACDRILKRGEIPEVLLLLARSYMKLGKKEDAVAACLRFADAQAAADPTKALETLTELVKELPDPAMILRRSRLLTTIRQVERV